MALVSIALNELGQRAVSLTGSQSGIMTDTVHGNARISRIGAFRLQENLAAGQVVIVAGFQGVSADTKEITTLGRGGSDLSAIALAAALGARSCQLYKDVDGVCSADPRVVTEAKVLSAISWDSMTDMAWSGASVLHPRGAHLAAKYNIPLEIRSSFHLDRKGTLVKGRVSMEQVVVDAITHKKKMTLMKGTVRPHDASCLDELRSWLWQQGETPQIQMQMLGSDGVEFYWSIPATLADEASKKLQGNRSLVFGPKFEECGIITVVGSGFWQSPETLDSVRKILPETMLLDVKNNSLTIAVKSSLVESGVKTLHEALVR
jgi:aspartate kinase